MGSLLGTTTLVYWIFYTVLLLVVYHKVFAVYYFNIFNGLMKELLAAIFLGVILAALSVYYWQIGVAVILIIALIGVGKVESSGGKTAIFIFAAAASVIVAIIGMQIKKDVPAESNNTTAADTYDDTYSDNDYEDMDYIDDDYSDDDYSDDNYEEEYDNDYSYDEGNVEEYEMSEFIFPYSDTEYLEISDVEDLTAEECRIARNEIYARHGRIFQDEALQAYFEQFDWYEGFYTAEEFDESVLNEIEISNRDLIIEYETEMGYR